MGKTKMGAMQAIAVITTVMISHIILNMPNHLITATGSSTILNFIYVFAIALTIFYFMAKIFALFPGKDIIDICEYTGGKFLKNAFSIFMCIYFVVMCGIVIRTFSESLVLIYFPNIDREMIILMFVAIATVMNLFGFKAISRVTLITLPVILMSIIIIFISSISSYIPERALPILGYGAYDTFVTGLGNIFCFGTMIASPFLIPYIGNGKEFKKVGFISLIIYAIYLILGIIALLFLIPTVTEINNTLSIYILSRRANFGRFIQRVDAIFILIWILLIFNYLAIIMNFNLSTFKKITNIKFERGMVFCFSAFVFTVALIPQDISDIAFFESTIYKYVSIILVFFVTMFILICAYFKRRKRLKKGADIIE